MQTLEHIKDLLKLLMRGLNIVECETLEETNSSKQSIARNGFEDSLLDFISENGVFGFFGFSMCFEDKVITRREPRQTPQGNR